MRLISCKIPCLIWGLFPYGMIFVLLYPYAFILLFRAYQVIQTFAERLLTMISKCVDIVVFLFYVTMGTVLFVTYDSFR